jgi:hypothetical protein
LGPPARGMTGSGRGRAKRCALCVLTLGQLFLSACSQSKYLIHGWNLSPYTEAFDGAANAGFVKYLTGENYVKYYGEWMTNDRGRGNLIQSPEREVSELITKWLVSTKHFGLLTACYVITFTDRHQEKCKDSGGCFGLKISSSVYADPKYRAAIISILRDPCKSLVDPRSVSSLPVRRSRPIGIGLGVDELWTILRCEKGGIHAYDIRASDDGTLIFRF